MKASLFSALCAVLLASTIAVTTAVDNCGPCCAGKPVGTYEWGTCKPSYCSCGAVGYDGTRSVVEQPCPGGLVYSQAKGYCDWAASLGCPAEAPPPPYYQDPNLPRITDECKKICEYSTPYTRTPTGNIKISGCSKGYCSCAPSGSWFFPCPADLVYNQEYDRCDYPYNVAACPPGTCTADSCPGYGDESPAVLKQLIAADTAAINTDNAKYLLEVGGDAKFWKWAQLGSDPTCDPVKDTCCCAKSAPGNLAFGPGQQVNCSYENIAQTIAFITNNPVFPSPNRVDWRAKFLRLGFHVTGTFNKDTCVGGSNGGLFRIFSGANGTIDKEAKAPENQGLETSRQIVEFIKAFLCPCISYGDLYTLTAAIAAEESQIPPEIPGANGPKPLASTIAGNNIEKVPWMCWRRDYPTTVEALNKLPDTSKQADGKTAALPSAECNTPKDRCGGIWNRLGFPPKQAAWLVLPAHTIGGAHRENSGYCGRFAPRNASSPTDITAVKLEEVILDNDYMQNLNTMVKGTNPGQFKDDALDATHHELVKVGDPTVNLDDCFKVIPNLGGPNLTGAQDPNNNLQCIHKCKNMVLRSDFSIVDPANSGFADFKEFRTEVRKMAYDKKFAIKAFAHMYRKMLNLGKDCTPPYAWWPGAKPYQYVIKR